MKKLIFNENFKQTFTKLTMLTYTNSLLRKEEFLNLGIFIKKIVEHGRNIHLDIGVRLILNRVVSQKQNIKSYIMILSRTKIE